MIREWAEWDKQEHETLENLKMTLETEKQRIEDQLEGFGQGHFIGED